MGVIGGFGLSISGYIYQLIFKNPLASPDIVGVSSGASAGAALAIVAVSASIPFISISAFIGAVTALIITLLTAYLVLAEQLYYRACRYSYSFCGTDYTYVSKACRRS